jgi:uncharacterized protein YndB with AHSA1/START domain
MVSTPPIEYATWIARPPEEVWPAVGTGAGWDGWFTSGTELEQRAGGALRMVWHEFGAERITAEDGGSVLTYDEPSTFAFSWGSPPSRVTFTLIAQDGGTRVEVVEDQLPDDESGLKRAVYCAGGWGEALTLLKFWLEHKLHFDSARPR